MTQPTPPTRWQRSGRPSGAAYDTRWESLVAEGRNVHGEADLVEFELSRTGGTRVLDAGCGTGRVAIELAARGFRVTGVDSDPAMIATARAKRADLDWLQADISDLAEHVRGPYDAIVLAGNVMIFVDEGTEAAVLSGLASRLAPAGQLIAGFQLTRGRLTLDAYDQLAAAAGLTPAYRYSTWERDPYTSGGDYAVSVHTRV